MSMTQMRILQDQMGKVKSKVYIDLATSGAHDTDAQELVAAARPFEEWYAELQQSFTIHEAPNQETESLVNGQGNKSLPIHRWYSLKESYSAALPGWACEWMRNHYKHKSSNVLDPFIGGGTTGVALSCQGIKVTGVEYNPFIRFVAAAKASINQVSVNEFVKAIEFLERQPLAPSEKTLPDLSTLHDRTYSTEDDVRLIMAARERVLQVDVSENIRCLLLLGVAGAIESVFALRKDGRALRYVPALATRGNRVHDVLSACWRAILQDVEKYKRSQEGHAEAQAHPMFDVYAGTALNLRALHTPFGEQAELDDELFDTIMYSPPYLNNFDYSEIYKLELWLLGFVEQYSEWSALRQGTLHSHPSISFPPTNYLNGDSRTADLAKQVAAMSESESLQQGEGYMRPVVRGYFDHMYQALKEQWRVMKPGGVLMYVVANSRHHYLPIATDVVIGEIARCIGFQACDLVVLRHRNGRTRQKLFLRESAVFLQKPS